MIVARVITLGAAGIAVALIVSGCSTTTSEGTKGSASAGSGTKASASASKKNPAGPVGTPFTVKGEMDGEQAVVTLVKVVDPTASTDGFTTADPGKRFVAYEFTIMNSGSVALTDDVDNDVTVYGSDGQQYTPTIIDAVSAGQVLDSITLAQGRSVSGFSVVELPTAVKTQSVQFGLDSGFAQFGLWDVT